MSKIEEYKAKKAELQAIRLLTTIEVSQVDHGNMGGLAAQFIFPNMSPGNVTSIINYLTSKQTQILAAIKADLKTEVNALLIEAKAEATGFVATNTAEV